MCVCACVCVCVWAEAWGLWVNTSRCLLPPLTLFKMRDGEREGRRRKRQDGERYRRWKNEKRQKMVKGGWKARQRGSLDVIRLLNFCMCTLCPLTSHPDSFTLLSVYISVINGWAQLGLTNSFKALSKSLQDECGRLLILSFLHLLGLEMSLVIGFYLDAFSSPQKVWVCLNWLSCRFTCCTTAIQAKKNKICECLSSGFMHASWKHFTVSEELKLILKPISAFLYQLPVIFRIDFKILLITLRQDMAAPSLHFKYVITSWTSM